MDNIGGGFVLCTDAASRCLPLYGLPLPALVQSRRSSCRNVSVLLPEKRQNCRKVLLRSKNEFSRLLRRGELLHRFVNNRKTAIGRRLPLCVQIGKEYPSCRFDSLCFT
jgi:hypothetical protein